MYILMVVVVDVKIDFSVSVAFIGALQTGFTIITIIIIIIIITIIIINLLMFMF